jgi:hypothetical protein
LGRVIDPKIARFRKNRYKTVRAVLNVKDGDRNTLRTRTEDRPMPASEAQIRANRANSLKSCGPKTVEGKEKSRANALKHGLTGAGVALTVEDTAEVERMFTAFEADFRPSDEMGRLLIRRAATCAVRMERAVLQETAALSERVLAAQAEAEANGEDPIEAGHRAMFDPSKEACLARKYEAAAERGFFRAIKEFRQLERETRGETKAPKSGPSPEKLGSFLPVETIKSAIASLPAEPARVAPPSPPKPSKSAAPAWNPPPIGSYDVPITIGRAR